MARAVQWAETVRRIRSTRDWSQDELAKALGCSVTNVSRWERGVAIPRSKHYRNRLTDLASGATVGRREEEPAPWREQAFQENRIATECASYLSELAHVTGGHGPYWEAIREYLKALLRVAAAQKLRPLSETRSGDSSTSRAGRARPGSI